MPAACDEAAGVLDRFVNKRFIVELEMLGENEKTRACSQTSEDEVSERAPKRRDGAQTEFCRRIKAILIQQQVRG